MDGGTFLSRLSSLVSSRRSPQPRPNLEVNRFRSMDEFLQFQASHNDEFEQQFLSECTLFEREEPFTVRCYCYVCQKPGAFHVDFALTGLIRGKTLPAWRESVICPHCRLSNRQRASIHLLDTETALAQDQRLYMTEQVTTLYKVMSKRHRLIEGSEYFGAGVERGAKDNRGIRNEDVTNLTFEDGFFAAIMSFEVLEHVPNYRKAMAELLRVLQPGGKLVLSVPFSPYSREVIVRARIAEDGSIEHLLEPEYHGDPFTDKGCLCFYHFGWQVLDHLREAGFDDAYVVRYPSRFYGYLGLDPYQIIATKSGAS